MGSKTKASDPTPKIFERIHEALHDVGGFPLSQHEVDHIWSRIHEAIHVEFGHEQSMPGADLVADAAACTKCGPRTTVFKDDLNPGRFICSACHHSWGAPRASEQSDEPAVRLKVDAATDGDPEHFNLGVEVDGEHVETHEDLEKKHTFVAPRCPHCGGKMDAHDPSKSIWCCEDCMPEHYRATGVEISSAAFRVRGLMFDIAKEAAPLSWPKTWLNDVFWPRLRAVMRGDDDPGPDVRICRRCNGNGEFAGLPPDFKMIKCLDCDGRGFVENS